MLPWPVAWIHPRGGYHVIHDAVPLAKTHQLSEQGSNRPSEQGTPMMRSCEQLIRANRPLPGRQCNDANERHGGAPFSRDAKVGDGWADQLRAFST